MCNAAFTMLRRRHHCRACMYVFCGDCCGDFVVIPPLLRRHAAVQPMLQLVQNSPPSPPSPPATRTTRGGTSSCNIRAEMAVHGRDGSEVSESGKSGSDDSCTAPAPCRRVVAETQRLKPMRGHKITPDNCVFIPPNQRAGVRHRLHCPAPVLSRAPDACLRYIPAKQKTAPVAISMAAPILRTNIARRTAQSRVSASPANSMFTLVASLWSAAATTLQIPRSHAPSAGIDCDSVFEVHGGVDAAGPERVCRRCRAAAGEVQRAECVIDFLLANVFFDLTYWGKLRLLSKTFYQAVNYLQTKWMRLDRRVFTLPDPQRDWVAVQLLRQNACLTQGHPNWVVLASVVGGVAPQARSHRRNTSRGPLPQPPFAHETDAPAAVLQAETPESASTRDPTRDYTCRELGCHVPCTAATITIAQCVQVFRYHPPTHPLHVAARKQLLLRIDELEPFAPILLWQASACLLLAEDVMLPAARNSPSFCTTAYFYTSAHPALRRLKDLIYDASSAEQKHELAASDVFTAALIRMFDTCESNALALAAAAANTAAATGSSPVVVLASIDRHVLASPPRLPGTVRFRVVRVACETATQLQSYTRPWVVTCTMMDCTTGREEQRALMLKREPVFKDDVVQRIQHYLLRVDSSLSLVPYVVTPIAPSSGLVLFLDDCESLASIQKRCSISAHLMANNQSLPVGDIQQQFMRSCAASAVLSLACGFGDRHLNNILVRKTSLVHVDFSYLFGEEPAISTSQFTLPTQSIRMTTGMIDVFRDNHYDAFLTLCAQINRLVRSVASELFCIAQALVCVNSISWDRLEAHFNQYMLPYTVTSNSDADRFIISVLEHDAHTTSSTGIRTFVGALLDLFAR